MNEWLGRYLRICCFIGSSGRNRYDEKGGERRGAVQHLFKRKEMFLNGVSIITVAVVQGGSPGQISTQI